MSTKSPVSIAERLNVAELAIANTLAEAEIQALVSEYGYTSATMTVGKTLLEAARSAVASQVAAMGAQVQAHRELLRAEGYARDAYRTLAKVSRAAFQSDQSRLTALGLNKAQPLAAAAFLAASAVLFENAPDAPKLREFGYDDDRLKGEQAKIAAFTLAAQKHRAAVGASQQATQDRDVALDELDAWRALYLKIVHVALRGKPQLIEKLGVIARTSLTTAQRDARRKKQVAA